jgi:hypothetical protein
VVERALKAFSAECLGVVISDVVGKMEGERTCWQGVVTGWYNSIKQISQVTSANKSFSNLACMPILPFASAVSTTRASYPPLRLHPVLFRRFLGRRVDVGLVEGGRGREPEAKWSGERVGLFGRWRRLGEEEEVGGGSGGEGRGVSYSSSVSLSSSGTHSCSSLCARRTRDIILATVTSTLGSARTLFCAGREVGGKGGAGK